MDTVSVVSTRTVRKIPWFPHQKGAWVMLSVPYWTGSIASGFRWQHILVFLFYAAGYSLFFTGENWLKSRHSKAYLQPVILWCAVSVMLAVVTVYFCGVLIPWVPYFLPFIAGSVWQGVKRKNRSLIARTCEVCAAGLMCAVAWDIGMLQELSLLAWLSMPDVWNQPRIYSLLASPSFTPALICTLLFTFYFWSTIPYIKSLVRERHSRVYILLSVAAHVLGFAVCTLLWMLRLADAAMLVVWSLLFVRAFIFTYVSRVFVGRKRSRTLSSKTLLICAGVTETFLSIMYAYVLLLSAT